MKNLLRNNFQIDNDNFIQHKILELWEKLSKIENNLKTNKNKIIENLINLKRNKFIDFVFKLFTLGKINKNKDIDNEISKYPNEINRNFWILFIKNRN